MDLNKEKQYLEKTLEAVKDSIDELDHEIDSYADIHEVAREHIWETIAEMDEYEQAELETRAQQNQERLIDFYKRKSTLEKQINSPYWGRINFKPDDLPVEDLYFGLSSVQDIDKNFLVIDWRAPIADVYYNGELGKVWYKAPSGLQSGVVNFKYQYKIDKGELKYVLDTSTTIKDEVLMHELAKNTSPLMKHIAATIQKEQNEIIRLDPWHNLLVQGVAGSGKTSIALHRIAYILYNAKGAIQAKDVLIISPNRAFSGYISQVLPELGEDNVIQIEIEEMAQDELKSIVRPETRAEYLEKIYNGWTPTAEEIADMQYKASFEFVDDLERELNALHVFTPRNFKYKEFEMKKEAFAHLYYNLYANLPWWKRMEKIFDNVADQISAQFRIKLSSDFKYKLMLNLRVMFRRYDTLEMYTYALEKLANQGKPVIIPSKDEVLPFKDVYGLLFTRLVSEGFKGKYGEFKMVTVDEMQDYFPMQYTIINRLFDCPKTVLGDLNQVVDPYMNIGSLENMQKLMGEHKFRRLSTSYRSSAEITRFANRLVPEKVNPIDRHDEEPEIIKCDDLADEAARIDKEIDRLVNQKGLDSIGIIARNRKQAKALAKLLKHPVSLLLNSDKKYVGGIVVTTAIIVKGFEFDAVLIPDADVADYSTDSEKSILYVTITRALHAVKMYYVGEPSPLLINPK